MNSTKSSVRPLPPWVHEMKERCERINQMCREIREMNKKSLEIAKRLLPKSVVN